MKWSRFLLAGIVSVGCLGLAGPVRAVEEVLYALSFPLDANLLTIDPATGAILRSVPITNEQALFGGLAFDGTFLWSIDGFNDNFLDRTFRIDPATGVGTVVGNTGFNFNFRSVEIDPRTGELYILTDFALYIVNKSTGAASLLVDFSLRPPSWEQATALAIDSTGTFYLTDTLETGLFRFDLRTRQVTHIGDLNLGFFFADLAFDSSGRLWGAMREDGGGSNGIYLIDIENVTATLKFGLGPWGIAFSPPNRPPVALCQDVTVPAGPGCVADASVDAGSFDPEGGPVQITQEPPGPYPLGETEVTLGVENQQGGAATCEATVTVEDVTSPVIQQLSASPSQLWPPNHKMMTVRMTAAVEDECPSAPQCRILSVRSNEPVDGTGDGDTAPDWRILDASAVALRAERAGRGTGRVYTIAVECADEAGNRSSAEVAVNVPKNQRRQ